MNIVTQGHIKVQVRARSQMQANNLGNCCSALLYFRHFEATPAVPRDGARGKAVKTLGAARRLSAAMLQIDVQTREGEERRAVIREQAWGTKQDEEEGGGGCFRMKQDWNGYEAF